MYLAANSYTTIQPKLSPYFGKHSLLLRSLWVLSILGLAQYQIFGNDRLSLRSLVVENGHRGVLEVLVCLGVPT